MFFYIIGHPRTGSGYMAKLMKHFDYEVGHEKIENNGISCWLNVHCVPKSHKMDILQPWGIPKRPESKKGIVIHHVRNPVNALASIILENKEPGSYEFRKQIIKHHFYIDLDDYNEIDKAALSYIYWNRLAEAQGPQIRVRVEDALEQLSHFFYKEVPLKGPSKETNTSKNRHSKVEWDTMSPKVYQLLDETCKRYGYPSIASTKLLFSS